MAGAGDGAVGCAEGVSVGLLGDAASGALTQALSKATRAVALAKRDNISSLR